jgi:hypothetical protein
MYKKIIKYLHGFTLNIHHSFAHLIIPDIIFRDSQIQNSPTSVSKRLEQMML